MKQPLLQAGTRHHQSAMFNSQPVEASTCEQLMLQRMLFLLEGTFAWWKCLQMDDKKQQHHRDRCKIAWHSTAAGRGTGPDWPTPDPARLAKFRPRRTRWSDNVLSRQFVCDFVS